MAAHDLFRVAKFFGIEASLYVINIVILHISPDRYLAIDFLL